MSKRDLLPFAGDRKARKAWDKVFSREVLGAVILGGAASKIVEKVVILSIGDIRPRVLKLLIAWVVFFVIGVYVFVMWHEISDKAKDAAEGAKEKAEEATSGDG